MKFILISTARSGSSYVVRQLAKPYDIRYHFDEILNTTRTYEFFDEYSKGSVYVKNDKIVKLNTPETDFYKLQVISWNKSHNVSCKILAHQIKRATSIEIENILDDSDSIAYLYRRDTTAQVYSTIISKRLKFHEPRKNQDTKTFIEITEQDFYEASHYVLDCSIIAKQIHQKYPGKVYCLEDDFEPKPYADIYDYNKSFKYELENIEEMWRS
jgi:hypothetical protein